MTNPGLESPLYDHNPLTTLDERDRFAFQSRRYGTSFLWVIKLPSGKIMIGDPKRDPIAVINSFSDLTDILERYKTFADQRMRSMNRAQERLMKAAKEEEDLSDIEINL